MDSSLQGKARFENILSLLKEHDIPQTSEVANN